MTSKVVKTDQEWRASLDPLEYQVTRHAATERAFTGKFWDHHERGVYTCVLQYAAFRIRCQIRLRLRMA